MKYLSKSLTLILLCSALFSTVSTARSADQAAKTFVVGGAYQLTAPAAWISREPRTRIVEHEFAIPAAKGDEQDGRMTVMGAGGGIEANIQRWYDQFTQPDGASTKDRAKIEKRTIAGQEVTIVDLSGTYMDRPGPMAPGVERPNYRMLAAIVETKKNGSHFFKFYGPQKTVTDNSEAFSKMLDSLKQK
jgi:hypothetical protein